MTLNWIFNHPIATGKARKIGIEPKVILAGRKINDEMSKYIGLWFFYDDDISIYWNRSHTFNVWNNGKEVNCFTVMESMTPKQAEQNADEWLADVLQEEKLRHADAF